MKKPKHIMELPTNVPRLKKGAGMIELPDGGKYFPGGERMSEFAPDIGKRGVKLGRLKGKLLEGFDMPTKVIKPTKEQTKMPLKEFMLPKDRYQKDLKKFRKAKKESFLGLGLGIKEEHPENIDKKTPYKNMDLLGKQKKKKIAIQEKTMAMKKKATKKKMTKGYARGGKISKMRMGGSKMTKGYARGGAIKKK